MSQDCIFCKIAKGEIPSDTVYEDEKVKAFNDIKPMASVHVVIIPKEHIPTLTDASKDKEALLGHMLWVAAEVARKKGVADDGYNILFNVNKGGGQVIFHLHLHVLAGRKLKAE